MKLRWYDRLLIALSAVALLSIAVLAFATGVGYPERLYDIGSDIVAAVFGHFSPSSWIAGALAILAAVVLFAWALRLIIAILPFKRKETFFNAVQNDDGKLSISLEALESLVRKCVDGHAEFSDSNIVIIGGDEKATVSIRTSMTSGVSMPKLTAMLQNEVKAYLRECAGVNLSGVDIIVEDTKALPAAPPPSATFENSGDVIADFLKDIKPGQQVAANVASSDEPSAPPKRPFGFDFNLGKRLPKIERKKNPDTDSSAASNVGAVSQGEGDAPLVFTEPIISANPTNTFQTNTFNNIVIDDSVNNNNGTNAFDTKPFDSIPLDSIPLDSKSAESRPIDLGSLFARMTESGDTQRPNGSDNPAEPHTFVYPPSDGDEPKV